MKVIAVIILAILSLVLIAGLRKPEIYSKKMSKLQFVAFIVLLGVVIYNVGFYNDDDTPRIDEDSFTERVVEAPPQLTPEEREAKRIADIEKRTKDFKSKISFQLDLINQGYVYYEDYRGSIRNLNTEINLFKSWSELVKESSKYDDPEIQEMGKQLEAKIRTIQSKELPIMRKEYARIKHQELWINDDEAKSSGTGHTTIAFLGNSFLQNRDKQNHIDRYRQELTDFRFKRVEYKWHQYDSEYTYYKLYEGKDSDLF